MTRKILPTWSGRKKALVIVAVAVLLLILVFGVVLIGPRYSLSKKTVAFIMEIATKQESIEADIREFYENGKFTFQDPLVIQNPYQTAPLTALLIFDTEEPAQISIHVPGNDPESDVDFTFPGFQEHHEIPVYGLYANTLNHVTLTMQTTVGENEQLVIDLQTEPLPVYIQNYPVIQADPAKYSPGVNFIFSGHKPAFDIDGNIRWYSTRLSSIGFLKASNGRILFTYELSEQDNAVLMEEDLLGKVYAIFNIADGIHHDICELPGGNLLITTEDHKSNTIEDFLAEIDRNNGHQVRSFDLKKYLDPSRPHEMDLPENDWLHLNSVVYDVADQSIIVSSKAQSAVIKMTYPGMRITWILGTHDNWNKKFQPYLLTPVGADFEWPWSQHQATLYGPNLPNDDVVDVLLFNNGMYRSFDLSTAYSPGESYSNVVHYQINEANMTVEEIWQYGKEKGAEYYSFIKSGAYTLPNGNVLGTWGNIAKDASGNPIARNDEDGTQDTKIIEINPTDNEVVFESAFNTNTYRTLRAALYEGYSENNAYLSTRINNTSANDLLDRCVLFWRDVTRVPLEVLIKRLGRRILALFR